MDVTSLSAVESHAKPTASLAFVESVTAFGSPVVAGCNSVFGCRDDLYANSLRNELRNLVRLFEQYDSPDYVHTRLWELQRGESNSDHAVEYHHQRYAERRCISTPHPGSQWTDTHV